MAVSVTINGTSYTIPQTGDEQWGDNVTAWIQAASQYLLQRNGGSFPLSADADFGGSAGLKALYFKSRTTNPGSTGVLRLANGEAVVWRNAAGTGDNTLTTNGSDLLTLNGSTFLQSSGTINANTALIANGSSQIASSAVTSTQLGYLSTTTSDVQTQLNGKQATGNYITSLTTDVVASGAGAAAATIQANVVGNSKLAQMATLTIKGNNTGGTANALDLTVAQVAAMLARQVVVGSAQTSQGTRTSTSYGAFSNSVTVAITHTFAGTFKVYGSFVLAVNAASGNGYLRINATSGSPTVLFSQETEHDQATINQDYVHAPFVIYTATAGAAVTWTLEGKTNSTNTVTLNSGVPTNGHALIVEQLT